MCRLPGLTFDLAEAIVSPSSIVSPAAVEEAEKEDWRIGLSSVAGSKAASVTLISDRAAGRCQNRLARLKRTAPASRVASATRRAMAGRETRLRHGDTAKKLLSRQRSAFSVQLQWLFHLIIDSK